MKYLNSFSENLDPFAEKHITEEDKKFFDLIFADFIDNGAESELYESQVKYYRDGLGSAETYYIWKYRIFISLAKMASKGITNSGRVVDLVNYSNRLNELVLDVQSCFKKNKR